MGERRQKDDYRAIKPLIQMCEPSELSFLRPFRIGQVTVQSDMFKIQGRSGIRDPQAPGSGNLTDPGPWVGILSKDPGRHYLNITM